MGLTDTSEPPIDPSSRWANATVDTLRRELRRRGISAVGRKPYLIQRLDELALNSGRLISPPVAKRLKLDMAARAASLVPLNDLRKPGFNCNGQILWGQMHCLIDGRTRNEFDIAGPPSNGFRFRTAARPGRWEVRKMLAKSSTIGYIAYSSEVELQPLLERVVNVGQSFGNTHSDKSIVYVDRFDWSWVHGSSEGITNIIEDEHTGKLRFLTAHRLFIVDVEGFDSIIQSLRSMKRGGVSESVGFEVDDSLVGVHLTEPECEYENAWLVFSDVKPEGQAHDELIAIVYDSSNSRFKLSGDEVSIEHESATIKL